MREASIDVTSDRGRIRLWLMQHPDTWARPSDVAEELDQDRTKVAVCLARMAREGMLDRREGETRKGVFGPRTEYRLKPGLNLLAPRKKGTK